MLELVEYAVVIAPKRKGSFTFAYVVGPDGNKTDEIVFCHYKDYRIPERVDGKVIWERFSLARRDGFHTPEVGDELVFERGTNAKGTKAVRWCYAQQAHRAHHNDDATTWVIRTEDGIVLWRGWYNPNFPDQPIVTDYGRFPHRIPKEFKLYQEIPGETGQDDDVSYLENEDMWEVFETALKTAKHRPV